MFFSFIDVGSSEAPRVEMKRSSHINLCPCRGYSCRNKFFFFWLQNFRPEIENVSSPTTAHPLIHPVFPSSPLHVQASHLNHLGGICHVRLARKLTLGSRKTLSKRFTAAAPPSLHARPALALLTMVMDALINKHRRLDEL